MNVEAAILCFEEAGPKMMVDFANVTQTQLYPTLGKGFVMFGSGDLLYGIIDLTKLGPETTKVEGWGSGTAANYFVAPAVDFLRQGPDKCPVLGGETK